MDETAINPPEAAGASKRFAQRLLATGGNRLELLMVEMQEEREHLLHTLLLGIGVAMLVLLASMAFSVAVVVLLWAVAPVLTLLALGLLYAGIAIFFYQRLVILQRNWESLPATLEQLRKDRLWLEKTLS